MALSLYTRLGILFKKATGVKDISLLRKDIHKKVGKFFYKKKYSTKEIIEALIRIGVKPGSVLCIHASMKEFYNYKGTAEELIDAIISYLTPNGTLMMPAYPDITEKNLNDYIFDPVNDKTAAGYLAETFRKYPDVRRSINVQHSVCALGKNAKWLTEDHHLGRNCWDECSPYYRMTKLNAIVVNMGMPKHFIGTFDHCVEGILYKEHPYWKQFLNKQQTYHYYDNDKKICQYTCYTVGIERRTRENRLIKHFNKDIYKKERISNLFISAYFTTPCFKRMLELGRKGITMYYVPSTKGYKF